MCVMQLLLQYPLGSALPCLGLSLSSTHSPQPAASWHAHWHPERLTSILILQCVLFCAHNTGILHRQFTLWCFHSMSVYSDQYWVGHFLPSCILLLTLELYLSKIYWENCDDGFLPSVLFTHGVKDGNHGTIYCRGKGCVVVMVSADGWFSSYVSHVIQTH